MISALEHQTAGVSHLVDVLRNNQFALDGSCTGWGKMYTSLLVCKTLGLQPAIICKKSVIQKWKEVADACGLQPCFVSNIEQCKSKYFPHGAWVRKNQRYNWELPEGTLMIVDEAHMLRNRKSQNSKMVIACIRQRIKALFLSATPGVDPTDFYTFGKCFGFFDCYKGYIAWMLRHGVTQGAYSFEFKHSHGRRVAYMDELHKLIFPRLGFRGRWEDTPSFPKNTVSTISITGSDTSKLKKYYDELINRMVDDEPLPVVDTLRARQFSELEKVPAMQEVAQGYLDEGKAVAVFLNFTQSIDAFVDVFQSYVVVDGRDTDREANIARFQENSVPLLVANIAAGGESISLHDLHGKQRVSLISPSWDPIQLRQVLGRIPRTGAVTPSLQHIFFCADTVEDRVRSAINAKLENMDSLMDTDTNPFSKNLDLTY